jgi:chorismate mutase/prephenate dehydratase
MMHEEEIKKLREEINRLNEEIIYKLAERVAVAVKIGAFKKRHDKRIIDLRREEKIYEQVRALAIRNQLDAEGVERVFKEIIRLCTEAQVEILS